MQENSKAIRILVIMPSPLVLHDYQDVALDRTLLVPGFQGIMVCLDMIGLGLASNALPPPSTILALAILSNAVCLAFYRRG